MANPQRQSMSLVKAENAQPLSLTYNPIWRTREVAIWWKADDLTLAEDAARYLNESASTLNKQDASQVVDTIYYGTEKLTSVKGGFRNVSAQLTKHEQKPAIVQTFREGWITEIPTLEKDNDEVRLMPEGTGADPMTGDITLMRRHSNIDPDYAEDILTTRKAIKTITDPQVDVWDKEEQRRALKVYSGKYAVTRLALQDQEDGAKQLVEGLLHLNIVDELSDLTALTPRLTQENEIFDLFGPNPAPGEGDTLGFTFYNIDPASRPFLMDASTDAQLVTYIAQKGGAAWATGTGYVACDIATNAGTFYICVKNHTAAATFAADLAAGNWTAWHNWSYASKKFVEQEDNTGRFYILFREVTWEAWGHDKYAFDSISYGNAGAANLSETRNKRYVGITIDDMETAVKELRADINWVAWATGTAYVKNAQVTESSSRYICATPHTSGTFATDLAAGKWVLESGYIIIGVDVDFNSQNGSCTLIQTIIEQINDEDEDGNIVLSPHAIVPGTAVIQTTNFRNFTEATLPAGDAIGGNIISNIENIQGNGLWGREVKTRIPTWAGSWAAALIMQESSASGYQLTEIRQATGVSEAARAAQFALAATASAADRIVVQRSQAEAGDGERVIGNAQKILNTDGSREPDKIVSVHVTVANQMASVQRIWYRNNAAAVATLTGEGTGKAATSFTYGANTYAHSGWSHTDHGDGAVSITQIGVIASTRVWSTPYDKDTEILEEAHEVPVRRSGEPIFDVMLRCQFRKIFATQALAAAYADGGDKIFDAEKGDVEFRQSQVQYAGNDKWVGRLVLYRALVGVDLTWDVTNPV